MNKFIQDARWVLLRTNQYWKQNKNEIPDESTIDVNKYEALSKKNKNNNDIKSCI